MPTATQGYLSGSGCMSLCQPSYSENTPPSENSTMATMNDQKNTALPQPSG